MTMLRNRVFCAGIAVCLIGVSLSACAGLSPLPSEPTPTPEPGRIVVGDISDEAPEELMVETQPLANYLAARLGDFGIASGEVRIAGSMEEMARLLVEGEVDIYFDSVYPAMRVADASGGQPFVRRWKDGVPEYHTVIFTTPESGIDSLDDLPGHLIAFEEEFSTSGYLLPAAYLIEQGYTLELQETLVAPVEGDVIRYLFSGDDDVSLDWLRMGHVSATATDNITLAELQAEVGEEFVTLAETEALPRQIGIARPGMDPALLAAITDILIHAHESEEGQSALATFSDTARFDEFPEGIDAAFARMRELVDIAQEISGPQE